VHQSYILKVDFRKEMKEKFQTFAEFGNSMNFQVAS
jgi:hypothetical protein